MKILLTGIDGYIGIELGQLLTQRKYDVVGLDAGFYNSGLLYNGIKKLPPIIWKDIRSITERDLKGFDVIIHLAELSNDPLGQINPQVTYDVNHYGTMEMAKKAKKVGIRRFIYFSSCSVYGASDKIVSETSPTNPLTAYAKSKVSNEKALFELADSNFSPTFLRNATAYGPSPRMRFDLAINNLCGLVFTTGKIAMESDGSPWRPFVHLLDICEAAICVLKSPVEKVHNETFNVGDTNANYQIKDIAQSISEAMPKCEITLNRNAVDKRNYRVDFAKINSRLPGFSCKRTVKSGIRELLDLFKKINLQKETFLSKEYTRLKQIEYLINNNKINSELFWNNKKRKCLI